MARRLITFLHQFLGLVGYLSLTLQWLWAISLYLPMLMSSDFARQLDNTPRYTAPTISLPSSVEIIFAGIITVVFICLSIYVLIKVPAQAIRRLNAGVTHSAERLSPIIVRHMPAASRRTRRQISQRIIFAIKLVLGIAPLGIAWFAPSPDPSINHDLIVAIGSFLALITLASFGAQLLFMAFGRNDAPRTPDRKSS